jgi:hypothetical protein
MPSTLAQAIQSRMGGAGGVVLADTETRTKTDLSLSDARLGARCVIEPGDWTLSAIQKSFLNRELRGDII